MPLTAPGSLSAEDYAAVMAFLLSYDCVRPSGNSQQPFPTTALPTLAQVTVGAPLPSTGQVFPVGTQLPKLEQVSAEAQVLPSIPQAMQRWLWGSQAVAPLGQLPHSASEWQSFWMQAVAARRPAHPPCRAASAPAPR